MGSQEHLDKLRELSPEWFDEIRKLLDTFLETGDLFAKAPPAATSTILPLLRVSRQQVGIVVELSRIYGQLHSVCCELLDEYGDSRAEVNNLASAANELREKLDAITAARTNIGFRGPKKG